MMYKRIPTQIVVAAYPEEDGAEKSLKELAKAMSKGDFPVCTNATIATRHLNGKIRVKELGKPTMLKGLVRNFALF